MENSNNKSITHLAKSTFRLYAITDDVLTPKETICNQVEAAINGGTTIIQFRSKQLKGEEKKSVAQKVKSITDSYNIPLIIDDDVFLAKDIDASGVHLGKNDMPIYEARKILGPDKIIGATAKTLNEALSAKHMGANYIGTGAAFATSTKADTWVISHDTIREIATNVGIPVVAIGGIVQTNISSLKGLGIDGVAVVSSVFTDNVLENAKILRGFIDDITSIKKVLSIAGSDSSGGAGIQADLKTMCAHGVYGMTVITSLTSQNTTGVFDILDTPVANVNSQLDAVFSDIYPDAIKIGMLSNPKTINAVCEKLIENKAANIVCDPVMISTSGHKLLSDDAFTALINKLLPISTIITPNIPEASVLSGMNILSMEDMVMAANKIQRMTKAAILIKGGHMINAANDLLYIDGEAFWFNKEQLNNLNTHGTGCTLSSAIACNLALGISLKESVYLAKEYVYNAINYGFDIGKGHGPLYHMYNIF